MTFQGNRPGADDAGRPPVDPLREALTSILDNATEDDCTPGFYDSLRAALDSPAAPEGESNG